MIILFRKAALETRDKEARLYIFCAGLMLITQAFLHIGVNTTLIPPTGLPLPFFSYGGTALAVNLGEMGVLLGISRYRKAVAPQEDVL
jgi:cell division protein FtsW